MERTLGAVVIQQPPLGLTEQPELYELNGELIIRRVFREVESVVDDVIIVATENPKVSNVIDTVPDLFTRCKFVRAENKGWEAASLVSAALNVSSDVTVVVPADAPFVTADLIMLLLQLVEGRDAVFLRDRKGIIDVLMAAYRNVRCFSVFSEMSSSKRLELREVPDGIKKSMVLNPNAIKALDPQLGIILRVRSRSELRLAQRIIEKER